MDPALRFITFGGGGTTAEGDSTSLAGLSESLEAFSASLTSPGVCRSDCFAGSFAALRTESSVRGGLSGSRSVILTRPLDDLLLDSLVFESAEDLSSLTTRLSRCSLWDVEAGSSV